MAQRSRSKAKRTASDDEDETAGGPPVIFVSSSDEEANEDLSLAIVEKARRREWKRGRAAEAGGGVKPGAAIDISTSSDDPDLVSNATPGPSQEAKMVLAPIGREKKKKKRKISKKKDELGEMESVDVSTIEEEAVEKGETRVTVANEAPDDNVVLRKLLRGPRYFDLQGSNLESCFNCGEEGHIAANCTMEKRKKPCYICGLFGHNSSKCMKEQDCFICKRRGHRAKDCPDKHSSLSSKFCLRCGDLGHEMWSCKNDYPPDDLKEIQCYICKKYGHLCCLNFKETGPTEVSCYKCAQLGHSGMGCGKTNGETSYAASPFYCYNCHEEGHFARGCTKSNKFNKWNGESSTPKRSAKKNRNSLPFGSAPHDLGKARKKPLVYEERRNMTTFKSKAKGVSVGGHSDYLHREKHRAKLWDSPMRPIKKSPRGNSLSRSRHGSSSWVPEEEWQSFVRTPSSHAPRRTYKHDISPSSYGNSRDRFRRT